MAVLDFIQLPVPVEEIGLEAEEAIINSAVVNADLWISLLSAEGSVKALNEHPKILRIKQSIKWLVEALSTSHRIRVEFFQNLQQVASVKELARFCAAVAASERKTQEEAQLKKQILLVSNKCEEYCARLQKVEELLDFCRDITKGIVKLVDEEFMLMEMKNRTCKKSEILVVDFIKDAYWAPFTRLTSPAEALYELKASHMYRNIAIHCLHQEASHSSSLKMLTPFSDAINGSEASETPPTTAVEMSLPDTAKVLSTKAIVSFHNACDPLFDDSIEITLNEASVAWKDVCLNELSKEISLLEKCVNRGPIGEEARLSIRKLLELPSVIKKARRLLEALESFGVEQSEESGLVQKLHNVVSLGENEETTLGVMVKAMDEDVISVHRRLDCQHLHEVITELGGAKEFITFIKEKVNENMTDLIDAVGEYSEQYVSEEIVSDLIKVHAYLRNLATLPLEDAKVLLSTMERLLPRGVDIAAKIQSCTSHIQALKSLCAENRGDKTKVIIRNLLAGGCFRLKLSSDGRWSVVMSYKGNERTTGDHTMAYLQDLRSRAHLLVSARKKTRDECPQADAKPVVNLSDFIHEVDLISELVNTCSKLQHFGHPNFREFEVELEATSTDTIKKQVEKVNDELSIWEAALSSARNKCTYLNFFHSDQLRILNEFFSQDHKGKPAATVKRETFALLCYIDPSINFDELDGFPAKYHSTSYGSQSFEDDLCGIGHALDEIFRCRPTFKTLDPKEDSTTQSQEFVVAVLEPESTQTVNAMISLFAKRSEGFPKPNQVLFCHKETCWDEVFLFIKRCFGNMVYDKSAPLYCMANVESLQSDLQFQLVRLLKEFQSYSQAPYNLCLLIRAERHHHIVKHFVKAIPSRVPWLSDSDMEESFRRYLPDVFFVTSELPGLGKTEWIRKDATMKKKGSIIFPVSGQVSREKLVQRLSSLELNGSYDCLHLDVRDVEDPLALDTILFEFIVIGMLSCGTQVVHRPTRHIYIEVTNTLNHWLEDSFAVCKCFTNERLHSGSVYRNMVVSTEVTSPVQVVSHYLNAMDEERLEDTDLCFGGPGKVEPLPSERCKELLSTYYQYQGELTYTVLNTFLNVFADQLLKFSASQYFRKVRLKETVEDPCGIRTEMVQALFNVSQEFVDFGRAAQAKVEKEKKPLKVSLRARSQAQTAEAMVSRVDEMGRWTSSNHLLFIFHDISLSFTPLYRDVSKIPPSVGALIKSQNRTAVLPNYKEMSQEELKGKLQDISNAQSTCAKDSLKSSLESYVLTVDNILKMALILLRLRAKVPVVIMGETGCGKTRLVQFLAETFNVPFHSFDFHAGITEEDILQFFHNMEGEAEVAKMSGKPVWVFLDEINTCDHLGLISEIICHRRIQGRPLPSNLVYIAACNPYYFRPAEARQTDGLAVVATSDELTKLVYRVHPLPEVIMDYVWDFGSLDARDEQSYILRMTERLSLRRADVFSNLLYHSQMFVRDIEKTQYCVSLRDVKRCAELFEWFRDMIQKRNGSRLSSSRVEEHLREDFKDVTDMDTEERAIVLSLAHCYQSRFANADLRKKYRTKMESIMKFSGMNLKTGDFMKIVRIEEEEYLARMELPPGTAKNAALRENVFVLLSSILNRIPVFVVGKPGSSKSLSMQVIRSNLRGADSPDEFLRSLPQLYVVSFQGSKASTSEGIYKVFEKARKYKEYNKGSSVLPVVLLDEVGLAEQSSNNPLKVLHKLLEPTNETRPDVAVVGISNWALDPAKMNRAIHISRPEPSVEDLCETGKSLRHASKTEINEHGRAISDEELCQLAKAYHSYQQTQKHANFHGLRDYYSLIRCLSKSGIEAMSSSSGSQCIQEAVQRNFGGLSDQLVNIQSAFMKELPKYLFRRHHTLPVKELICRNLQDSSARHLLLLTAGDSSVDILNQWLQEMQKETITIFGSHFKDDLEDYNYRVLSQIILHMERDCVLILRDLENIYGSLYDVLNQNYTTSKGKHFCRVALGPYSVPRCQVHDRFRCIVLIDQDKVDYTDPPFLHRFEKQSLHFKDVLSSAQMSACKELTLWARDVSHLLDRSLLFNETDMFVGFSEDSIPSLVLYHDQHRRVPDGELTQKCKDDLMLTATPEGILRAVRSKWAEPRHSEVQTMCEEHLRKHAHRGLKQFIQQSLEEHTANITCEARRGLQLVVMTHSSVHQNVADLLEDVVTCQTANLSSFNSERHFTSYVKRFWTDPHVSLLVLQCKPDIDGCHMLLARNVIEQEQREYHKSKRSRSLVNKHLCFILHVQKGLISGKEQSASFFNFLNDWSQVTIDSLENPKIPLPSLLEAPVWQVLGDNELFTEIIRDQLLWCFTCIKYVSYGRPPSDISGTVEMIRGSRAITDVLKELVRKWLEKDSSSPCQKQSPWLLAVALNQETLTNFSTFNDAVYNYIADQIKRPLAKWIYQLERVSAWNAFFVDEGDNQKAATWINLLRSGKVIDVDQIPLPRGSECYILDKPVLNLVYPFSSAFATHVEDIKGLVMENVKILEDDKENVDENGQLKIKDMFDLVKRFSSLLAAKLQDIFEVEWLQSNALLYVEDLMDIKAVEFTDNRTLSRDCRVAVMKAISAPQIRQMNTAQDLSLFLAHVHIWTWVSSSLITSVLQLVKVCHDLDPSNPLLNEMLQENSLAFPTTLPHTCESHGLQDEHTGSNPKESPFPTELVRGMEQAPFEESLVEDICRSLMPTPALISKVGNVEAWQRSAALVLTAAAQIFQFGCPPTAFHVLRVCNDFVRLLVLPGLASVELLYSVAKAGEVPTESFLHCLPEFQAVCDVAKNAGPRIEAQQFLALFFRRCINSWMASYPTSYPELISVMINTIFAAKNDVDLAYMGPAVECLLWEHDVSMFHQLLYTSNLIEENPFLLLLDSALQGIKIDAHPAVLICDLIEDCSFRNISCMDTASGTTNFDDHEEGVNSHAPSITKDVRAASEILSKASDETGGLRMVCAVAFLRSFLRSVAEYMSLRGCDVSCSKEMASVWEDFNGVLQASIAGTNTEARSVSLCLYLLRKLRQTKSMHDVKRLVQSNVILPALQKLIWNEDEFSKLGSGPPTYLKKCSETEDAVSDFILKAEKEKLCNIMRQPSRSHTEWLHLFSAVSNIYLAQGHRALTNNERTAIKLLAKELEGLNNASAQLIHRLIGVTNFCTPELQLNPESSSPEVQRAFLLTHIAAWIMPAIQDDSLIDDRPFVALMANPDLCDESYVPGLLDTAGSLYSLRQVSRRVSPSDLTYCTCSCGAAFIATDDQLKCPTSSAQCKPVLVSCGDHSRGVTPLSKGYIRINPERLTNIHESARELEPVVFRILHFLVHACLYLGSALGLVKEHTLSGFIAEQDESPSVYCFKHICNDLDVLAKLLNSQEEDAINLVHLVLNCSGNLLVWDRSTKLCKEPAARELWEARFAESVRSLLSDNDQRCVCLLPQVTEAFGSTCTSPSLELMIEERDCPPNAIVQGNSLVPRMFRSRRPNSTASFKAAFLNDEEEVRKHPFLKLVLTYEDVLPLLRHLVPLLKWISQVESRFSHVIGRHESETRRISSVFFEQVSGGKSKPPLQMAFENFQEAWSLVSPMVKEEMGEVVPFITEHDMLSSCLLEEKGHGKFLYSALTILARHQNEFLMQALALVNGRACQALKFLENPSSTNVIPLVHLQECSANDVICFEWPDSKQVSEDEDDSFLSYSQHNTEYGRGWDIHYDFGRIEMELASTLVLRKAYLCTHGGLREFVFSNEQFLSGANVLKEVQDLITQEPLTKELKSGLQHLETGDRTQVQDLFSCLEIVLCFLKRTRGEPDQPLIKYIDTWISVLTGSFPISNLPQPHDKIQLRHTVALYEGLEDILAGATLRSLTKDFRKPLSVYLQGINWISKFSDEKNLFSLQATTTALCRFMFRYLYASGDLSICKVPLVKHLVDRTLWPMETFSDVSLEEKEITRSMHELFPETLMVEHIYSFTVLLQELQVSQSIVYVIQTRKANQEDLKMVIFTL